MPQSQRPSALQDYMQNYGERLQSALSSISATTMPQMATDTSPAPTVAPMQSALTDGSSGSPVRATPERSLLADTEQPSTAAGEDSFADHWLQMPRTEQKQHVDSFEQSLARGNQTIDSAFDDMVKQLGTRPSGKLTREDKGMLLMEFGLSLMANSRPGVTFGESVGAAGLQTMGRHQERTRGEQKKYDSQLAAIEGARAKSKSALAEKGAVEHIKGVGAAQRAQATAEGRASELAGTFDTEQGVYGRTHGGAVSALKDPETGERLQPRERAPGSEPLVAVLDDDGNEIYVPRSQAIGRKKRPPASSASGGSLKASDTNAIYRQAAGLYGGMFDPMTGRIAGLNREQSEQVQSIAARASQLYMQSEGALDHASAVQQAFEEIRSGRQSDPRSELESTPSIPADAPRRTIGGKRYVQIDGQWYEEE